jgi:hypothetical protein
VVGTLQAQVTTQVNGTSVIKRGVWNFDLDGDGNMDKCNIDQCIENFCQTRDLAIIGDWNGTDREEIGVFRPQTVQFYLDLSGHGKWHGQRWTYLWVPTANQETFQSSVNGRRHRSLNPDQ